MPAARIRVRVTPRAGRDRIDGRREGVLRVRLTAPPVEGRANEALVRLLARALGVPPRDVRVVRGGSAREKLIEVEGIDEGEMWRRLTAASAE
jgi:uncharacterized protein (TIGR00251 family)